MDFKGRINKWLKSGNQNLPINVTLQNGYNEPEAVTTYGLNGNADNVNNYPELLTVFQGIAEVSAPLIFWANNSSKVGFKIFDVSANGDKKEVTNTSDPLHLLLKKPNPFMGFSELKANELICSKLMGNSYINALNSEKVGGVRPAELWLLPPQITTIKLVSENVKDFRSTLISNYIVSIGGNEMRIEPGEVLHRKNITPGFSYGVGLYGMSSLNPAEKPINSISSAYSAKVKQYKEGAKGLFTPDAKYNELGDVSLIKEKDIEAEQKALEKYGAVGGKYTNMISRLPLKYQKTSYSLKELNIRESIIDDADVISSNIGVPLLLYSDKKNATYENKAQAEKDFYLGNFKSYEDEFYKDLTVFVQSFKIWKNRVIEPDFSKIPQFIQYITDLQTVFGKDAENGIITRNEYLRNTNRPISENKEFDEYYTFNLGEWLPLNAKRNDPETNNTGN